MESLEIVNEPNAAPAQEFPAASKTAEPLHQKHGLHCCGKCFKKNTCGENNVNAEQVEKELNKAVSSFEKQL